jgi:ribonuclease Y
MQKSFGPKPQYSNNPVNSGNQVESADLVNKEKDLAKREGILEERERIFQEKAKVLEEKLERNETVRKDLIEKLEKVTNLSPEEAKDLLLANLDKELATEISKRVKASEETIKLQVDDKSKEILVEAMYNGYAIYNFHSPFAR